MKLTPEKIVLSVSQLNRNAKQLLEMHLPLVWISGELSNFAQPASGHWYFSLKDDKAQVRCAMFKQANSRLRWQPQSGKQIMARARVSLYEGRGEFQLIVEHMEEAGTGALQQQYEALKAKLQTEGLFKEANKQALPSFPQHIGIITSPTGAAVHDILTVLARRYPVAKVSVIPTAVQGENAAGELISALSKAERFGGFDLLMIGRGGGSIEDLWAFNDEALARAIHACPIPLISGVGHEVDFTICDFVADVRAPTPSACAEMATPNLEKWQQTLDIWQQGLIKAILAKFQRLNNQLLYTKRRLRHPGNMIQSQRLQIQALKAQLIQHMQHTLHSSREHCTQQLHRLQQRHPKHRIHLLQQRCQQLNTRFVQAIRLHIKTNRQTLSNQCKLLDAVSPLAVLGRGYSIVSQQNGKIVRDTQSIAVGDSLNTQLSKGSFTSHIVEINET